jgi:hypothetical protein
LINVHRRWLLPAILGGVILLLASTGLFLIGMGEVGLAGRRFANATQRDPE